MPDTSGTAGENEAADLQRNCAEQSRGLSRGVFPPIPLRLWQIKAEGCAFAERGVEIYPAVVVVDGAVDHGKSHTGTDADGFGGEEGVEDFCFDFFAHAAAVVFYFNKKILCDIFVFKFGGNVEGQS